VTKTYGELLAFIDKAQYAIRSEPMRTWAAERQQSVAAAWAASRKADAEALSAKGKHGRAFIEWS
jgi:multidrug resistance efflux pump